MITWLDLRSERIYLHFILVQGKLHRCELGIDCIVAPFKGIQDPTNRKLNPMNPWALTSQIPQIQKSNRCNTSIFLLYTINRVANQQCIFGYPQSSSFSSIFLPPLSASFPFTQYSFLDILKNFSREKTNFNPKPKFKRSLRILLILFLDLQ